MLVSRRAKSQLALIAVLAVGSLPAWAQGAGERLVPATGVISSPGTYVLRSDLRSSPAHPGVEITSSGVTLNLGGHQIIGPGGNQGIGIMISGVAGVSITNGQLSANAFGVFVQNSSNIVIRGLQIRGTDFAVSAPPPEVGVMLVHSRNVVVEDNLLNEIGLGIFVRGSGSWGNHIVNNTITAGDHGLIGICYNPAPDDPVGPSGDLVEGNLASRFNLGIQTNAATNNVFRGNTLFFKTAGLQFNDNQNEDIDNTLVQLP
jgi:nitrous oxidase accessory protein NosD